MVLAGSVYAREEEGSADWTDLTGTESLYVDGTETTWGTDGRDRIHLTARFRVSDQARGGKWRMFGYARDQDGNLPVAPWHELLEGWPIEVAGHVATAITSAASDQVAPQKTRLDSIYPNPFNPVTAIHFTLSAPQHVTLSIHSLTGQLVKTLFSEPKSRGSHSATWDASDLGFGRLPVQADKGLTKSRGCRRWS